MIRSACLLVIALLGALVFARPVVAQSITEYSTATAGTTGAAGAANGIGKNIGGIMNNLEKSLPADSSKHAATPSPKPKNAAAAAAKPDVPPAPAPHYEDPSQIQVSMAYDEVLRRFGPPSMEITNESAGKTLLYNSPGGSVHIEVLDGTVTSAPRTNRVEKN